MRDEFLRLKARIISGTLPNEPSEADASSLRELRNERDDEGRSLLLIAELYGRVSTSRFLLFSGYSPLVKDCAGYDYFDYMARFSGAGARELALTLQLRENALSGCQAQGRQAFNQVRL